MITEYSIAYVLLASKYIAEESKSRSSAELMEIATSHPLPRSRRKAKIRAGFAPSGRSQPDPNDDDEDDALEEQERQEAEAAGECDPRVQALTYVIGVCGVAEYRLEHLPLERLLPAGAEEARLRLAAVVKLEQTRIEQIRARHVQVAEADAAGAALRLALDPSPDAERQRRYILARDRLRIQSINTFLKVRKATLDGTLEQIEIEPGDRPDVENLCQSPDPSLELRAGMTPSAPAGDERPGALPAHAPFHTSPMRQRGTDTGSACQQEIETSPACPEPGRGACKPTIDEMPQAIEQVVARTLCDKSTYVDGEILRNEAIAEGQAPPDESPPQVVAGTVPVPSSPMPIPTPQIGAGTVPSTQLRAGPSAQPPGPVPSSPSPTPPPPAEAGSPIITLTYVPEDFPRTVPRERWQALAPDVINQLQGMQEEFRLNFKNKHLDANTIEQYREYFKTHLG